MNSRNPGPMWITEILRKILCSGISTVSRIDSPSNFIVPRDMLISDQRFCLSWHRHYSQPTLYDHAVALKLFHGFVSGWLSSEMNDVLNKNLDKLPRAVGDPFQSTPDLCLQDGKPGEATDDEPMMATVVLIELVSSDLWQNHLNHSNFASCEKVVFTREGKRTALRCMLDTATRTWSQYLCTPARITAAIRRLEELQCLNIAEVVILWSWTVGVPDMGTTMLGSRSDTIHSSHQTYGTGRLPATPKQHTLDIDKKMEIKHMMFLLRHYRGPPCRVGSTRSPVPIAEEFVSCGGCIICLGTIN